MLALINPDSPTISDRINEAFEPLVEIMEKLFFWDPFKAIGWDIGATVPIVVLWLILGGIFFTIRMKFINIRAFPHAIRLIKGDYDKPGERGEVSHFQALATALSATVGLGNITGVAVAITVGGPGATFWMIIAGFFGMSLKFTECTLGLKFRKIDKNGQVSGGPMYYLKNSIKTKGIRWFGKFLAGLYALLMVGASFGGSNMLQSNQAFAQFSLLVPGAEKYGFWFGLVLAFLVGIVIIGGIKSIARVTGKLVPFMALFYVGAALVIIVIHLDRIDDVFTLIFRSAINPQAIKGGLIGVLITGFQRGAFSNEAGVGSAAVAHAAARTNEPVREGIVAMLGPFIDTIIICTITSLVLIFSGLYQNPQGLEGTQLTSAAFETVFPWFPYLLVFVILLFAFSTMISWSYYGLKGFTYLFGDAFRKLFGNPRVAVFTYFILFSLFTIIGASSTLDSVLQFSDMMVLTLAFPNIIGLLILSPIVVKETKEYMKRLKNGEFVLYKKQQ